MIVKRWSNGSRIETKKTKEVAPTRNCSTSLPTQQPKRRLLVISIISYLAASFKLRKRRRIHMTIREELERNEIWQYLLYIQIGDKIYTKQEILEPVKVSSVEVAYAR